MKTYPNAQSQIRKSKKEMVDNYFTKIVIDSGIVLNDYGNEINCESGAFKKKIKEFLESQKEVTESLKLFGESFEKYIKEETFFVSAMLPTQMVINMNTSVIPSSQIYNTQDSLIILLLQVDILQPFIIDVLLKKLPVCIENENLMIKHASFANEKNSSGIVIMPRLILNNLRWLNHITNSSEIASKLIDMASVMPPEVACDIITFIHNFLTDDAEHETVAKRLCDLLNERPENLISSVFDALSNLILDEEILRNVQDVAVSYLNDSELKDISVIIKFLLKKCSNIVSAMEVISLVRPQLDFPVLMESYDNLSREEIQSGTKLIGDTIFAEMQFQSVIANAWVASIEKLSSNEITFGDVVCMLLLCDVNNFQQTAFNFFQSRLKHGSFPVDFLSQVFQSCSHILAPHYKALCNLAQCLVRHSDPVLKQSGARFYELILIEMDKSCKEEAIMHVVQHISLISVQSTPVVDTALDVLCTVAKSHPDVFMPYGKLIWNALDRMEVMTLSQVRKSYTVLSWLAYSSSNYSLNMKNEIHIMLKKQLSSANYKYRHIGKIGSVTTLLAMSKINETETPSMQHKDIESFVQSIDYLLGNDVWQWSLFYNEIFIAFSSNENVPPFLLRLVNHDASIRFHSKFFMEIRNLDTSISDLELSLQYNIAEDSEMYVSITPNILNLRSSASYLCALFLSISWIENQIHKCFNEVDALISCPLYLFNSKYQSRSVFKKLTFKQQFIVLDSLFAVINWFRVLISVFSLDQDVEIQLKVVQRLNNICESSMVLQDILSIAPRSYLPPNMDVKFSSLLVNKGLSPSVNCSLNTTRKPHCEIPSTSHSNKPTKMEQKKCVVNKLNVSIPLENLWELDKDVFVLLKHRCKTLQKDTNEVTLTNQSQNMDGNLKPCSLLYLLQDLCLKLKHRISTTKNPGGVGHHKTTSNFCFERFNKIPAGGVIKMAVDLLPDICNHLEAIFEYLQNESITQADESMSSNESGEYIIENETFRKCCSISLEIILQILSWNGLKNIKSEKNKEILQTILQRFCERLKNKVSSHDHLELLSCSFRYFFAKSKSIHSCSSAHSMVKILIILCEFAGSDKPQPVWMKKNISELANHYLVKYWDGWSMMPTQKQNRYITGLFGAYLNYSEEPISLIEFFLNHGLGTVLVDLPDSENAEKKVYYPCLSKSNFYQFYTIINETITKEMLKIPAAKPNMNDETLIDILLFWGGIIEIWVKVINLVKTFTSRLLLGPALKNAQCILENFIKHGMLVCEFAFTKHQDDVINMFKTLQMVTRNLQYVTHHSKTSRDSVLINHVSAVKLLLETLVYKVKTMLAFHNCHEAFWLGRLKNRNLQGKVLLSQAQNPSSEEDQKNQLSDLTNHSDKAISECF